MLLLNVGVNGDAEASIVDASLEAAESERIMLHAKYVDANTNTNANTNVNFQAAEVERLRFMLHEQVLLHDYLLIIILDDLL